MTLLAPAGIGDYVVASFHVHGGIFHRFKVLAPPLGIETRFVTWNDPEDIRSRLMRKQCRPIDYGADIVLPQLLTSMVSDGFLLFTGLWLRMSPESGDEVYQRCWNLETSRRV